MTTITASPTDRCTSIDCHSSHLLFLSKVASEDACLISHRSSATSAKAEKERNCVCHQLHLDHERSSYHVSGYGQRGERLQTYPIFPPTYLVSKVNQAKHQTTVRGFPLPDISKWSIKNYIGKRSVEGHVEKFTYVQRISNKTNEGLWTNIRKPSHNVQFFEGVTQGNNLRITVFYLCLLLLKSMFFVFLWHDFSVQKWQDRGFNSEDWIAQWT